MNEKIDLKVFDAYDRDVGWSSARIDYDSMNSLNVSTGDMIEIKGKQKTVARCLPLYPTDERKHMVRINGLIRNNAGTEIDSIVTIKKILTKRAEHVTVRSVESIPPVDGKYMVDALEKFPIVKGDHLLIPYFGGRFDVEVIDCFPEGALLIDPATIFTIVKDSA